MIIGNFRPFGRNLVRYAESAKFSKGMDRIGFYAVDIHSRVSAKVIVNGMREN